MAVVSLPFHLPPTPSRLPKPPPSPLNPSLLQPSPLHTRMLTPRLRFPSDDKFHFRLRSAPPTTTGPSSATAEEGEEALVAGFEGEDEGEFDWFSQWYPLAPVCDLDKRVPHAKTVLGIDVVLWWDKVEGKWQVFGDSCPHRLAPLSEGRIDRWGRLQCVYHGWCFDGKGSCKLIPQAPRDGPQFHTFKKACATVYPSIEQNKIIWFWPNSDPKAFDASTKKMPPYVPELDDPSFVSSMGIREINYGYEVLVENLMDPSHVPYAHHGIMRYTDNPNRVDREGGRPLDIAVLTINSAGFLAKHQFGYSKFAAPCAFYGLPHLSQNKDSPSSPQKKRRRALLVFLCVPVSPGKSRLIFVSARNFAVWINGLVPRWVVHLNQNLILDSDLYLLHLEEQKIAELGPSNWQKFCFVPTKADGLVVGFRKWIKKYANGQLIWGDKFSTGLPPTPPREQLMDRYWTHVVQCRSCHGALKCFKVLEVGLQVAAIASIGIVAILKQSVSSVARSAIILAALVCFVASRWLAYFIRKNFYYHDYNHAFK